MKLKSKIQLGIQILLLSSLSVPQFASAHSVGQVQTTKFFTPETVQMLKDRAIAGHPGFVVGDTISYIIQYTPVSNGADTGVAGYITDYVPPGVQVIGASIVSKDTLGNYIDISPSLPAGIDTGWGNLFGQSTYAAPFNVASYDPTGLCAAGGYTNNCNGRLTEIYADTGIFYSTDPRTSQYPAAPTRILQGANGYYINPDGTGVAGLDSLLGQTNATTHNLWDADQTNAFGSTALPALSPQSSQTIISSGRGATPFDAGSAVAGPGTGYQLDNTGQVGPWQRIAYPGSRMGNTSIGPATTGGGCTTCVGGFSTSTGWNLSSANPLPSGTNAVRWATGQIVVGEMRYVKISMKLTAPIPSGGLINGSEVFGGDAGGSDNGLESTWDYHVPSVADNNSNLFVLKEIIGVNCPNLPATCTVTNGSYIPVNAKVRYQITYLNTGNATQTNVILSDTLPCQTGAAPVSYNGVANTVNFVSGPITSIPVGTLSGIAAGTNALTCSPAGRQTFSFPTIATLGPGEGGTIVYDVQTNAALNSTVPNTATLASALVSPGVNSTANSYVQTAANLGISKSTSTPTVAGGGTASYTITVTNNGTAAASAISIYDELPTTGGANDPVTRFSYLNTASAVCGGVAVVPTVTQAVPPTQTPYNTGGVSSNQQEVHWNLGATTLAVGATCTITFNATVGSGVPASATPYTDTAIVTYTGGSVTRNDTTSVAPVTVTSTLSVTKTITDYYDAVNLVWVPYSNFIPANAKVRYRIDYANTGAGSVTGAILSDTLPCQTGAAPVSYNGVANTVNIVSGPITAPAGATLSGIPAGNCGTSTRQTFSFPSATINAGQSGQIILDVQTNAATGNIVSNAASLSGTGASAVSNEVQTSVQSIPALTVSKTESVTAATVGQTVTYTLTVTNTGTANATNISVFDWLPTSGGVANAATRYNYVATGSITGMTAVVPTTAVPPIMSPYSATANQQEVAWNFGAQTLLPGASFTITYTASIGASVTAPALYTNYASAYFGIKNLAGTVSATNGSATVTGTGTSFATQLSIGNYIYLNGNYYTVLSIASNTSLTLTTPYTGTTAAGLSSVAASRADSQAVSMNVSATITDVAVTKTDGAASVTSGGTTTYTLVATNTGSAAVTANSGATSITFSAAGKTLTRTAGSFITDGFVVGNRITTDSPTNPGPFTVLSVTATVITVSETVVNEGPVSRTVVAPTFIVDAAAVGLSKTSVICAASGGAVCPGTVTVAQLEGSGLAIPVFPSGGQITLTIATAVTSTGANVTNSVTATLPTNISDSNWNNNTASDTDTVLAPNLSTSTKTWVDPNGGDQVPGDTIRYTITLRETGGMPANGVAVTDDIPANISGFSVVSIPAGAANSSAAAPSGANGTGYLNVTNINVPANGSVTIVFDATIAAGTPIATSINNCGTVTPAYGAAPCASTVTVSASSIPGSGNKQLYLYDATSTPAYKLSRAPMGVNAGSSVAIVELATQNWTLSPVLQKNVTIDPALSATIPVQLWLSSTNTRTYNIAVTLRCGATSVATLTQATALTNGAAPALFTYNLPLASPYTCTAGNTWALSIYNPQSGGGTRNVLVYPAPAAASYSNVTLPSTTVINVDSVTAYSTVYPGVTIPANFAAGSTAYLRAVVSDPFGSFDISSATITIKKPDGTTLVSSAAMTQVADSGAATRTFEYAYAIPAAGPAGAWTVTVNAKEGTENTISDNGVGAFQVTVPAPALVFLKTVSVYWDPVNLLVNPKFIPGAQALYTLIATNTGTGAVDNNALVITDPVPTNTALYVNDLGAVGSGPVAFSQGATSSGLTYTFTALSSAADNLDFSTDGGATWTAVPVPGADGCDPTINSIRIRPQGAFAGSPTAPSPSFNLAFRVCVK